MSDSQADPRGRPERSLARATGGAVYVEFLVAFVPLFTLFLGLVQMALLFPAKIVVDHAAYRAARAAAVVLDDDPVYYGGEARNSLAGDPLTASQLVAALTTASGGAGGAAGLSRRATVELAAAMTLAPLWSRASGSIGGAIGAATVEDSAKATRDALKVTISTGGTEATDTVGARADLTVRVDYAFRCAVPIAAALMCHGDTLDLEAEATLPNQGARYLYKSQVDPKTGAP